MKLDRLLFLLLVPCLLVACKDRKSTAGPGGPPTAQVVVVPAKSQSLEEKISLVGNVLANEAVEVKSEIDGTVSEIHFKEGQSIEKGAPLVTLDDRKLRAEAQQADANFKLSESNVERARQLVKENLISQQEFDQLSFTYQATEANLELKRQQLRDVKITAPFEGVVGARFVSPGQVISKNSPITWVTDLDPVKVDVNVPERFLGQLKVGQALDIKVAAYPNETFRGKVYFVAQNVDPSNRTALIKAELANPDYKLKPGMFANLELTMATRENAVVIPEVALTRVLDNNRAMVFVVDSNNIAQLRPVELGIRMPGEVEIQKGIEPGEIVIVEGMQKTIPGRPVKLAPPEAAARYQRP
ncbi:MAG: efflux RND transporter periplasmic adaptor subunit [Verrucomicrobia bacterium]|nr:efflux RND transporter periplasmic adaptor subunit [Verrucomicrobiota bacterium]